MIFNMNISFPLFGKYRNQLLSVLCANIAAIAHGAGIGWLSPTILVLQSSNTPLNTGILSVDQASWLGSLLCVGGLTGNLGFGLIANHYGRRLALALIPFPQICFWIIVTFVKDINYLYMGRILAGMTGGGCFVTIPLFVSDVASKEVRGSLGSIMMLTVNCGTLLGYIVGSYLPYEVVPKVIIVLPIIHFCLILFFPETPQFLLLKGKETSAKKSLCFYRNLDPKSTEKTTTQQIEKEMDEIKSVMGSSPTEKATLKDFFAKDVIKSMFLGFGLVGVNIFSGIFLIVNYNALIFREAGIDIAPNDAAIVVAVSQIIAIYVSTLIVDRFRRKALLIVTTTLSSLSLLLVGTSTYILITYQYLALSWIPVIGVSLTVFSACCGYIPLTFVVMNEVIPRKVRPIIASICNAALNVFAFTSLKLMPLLIAYAGVYTVMWICSAMCLLGVLFNAIFVPETSGKVI